MTDSTVPDPLRLAAHRLYQFALGRALELVPTTVPDIEQRLIDLGVAASDYRTACRLAQEEADVAIAEPHACYEDCPGPHLPEHAMEAAIWIEDADLAFLERADAELERGVADLDRLIAETEDNRP